MTRQTATLTYGDDKSLELSFDSQALVVDCAPRGTPLSDVGQAVTAALEQALEHPPWSQTVYPGDRVVIAVDPALPRQDEVLDAVIAATVQAGVSAKDVSVLFGAESAKSGEAGSQIENANASADDSSNEFRDAVQSWKAASEWSSRTNVVRHQPANRAELAFLGGGEDGEPIMLARALAEADVVLLASVARGEGSLEYAGINGILCQTFGDEQTQRRFRALHASHSPAGTGDLPTRQADKIAWTLGANFCLQVIPGERREILQVLAGKQDAVAEAAARAFHSAWQCAAEPKAGLVIAAVDAVDASWLDLAASARTAEKLADDDAAIVLLTDLAMPAGSAVAQLATVESAGEALVRIQSQQGADTVAALELAQVLESRRVYLVSRLEEEVLHDLHFIPVDDPADIQRVIDRSDSVSLVRSAQFANAGVRE